MFHYAKTFFQVRKEVGNMYTECDLKQINCERQKEHECRYLFSAVYQVCRQSVSVAYINVAQFSQLVGTDIIFFPFYSCIY